MINEKLDYFNINSNEMVLSPENGKQINQLLICFDFKFEPIFGFHFFVN